MSFRRLWGLRAATCVKITSETCENAHASLKITWRFRCIYSSDSTERHFSLFSHTKFLEAPFLALSVSSSRNNSQEITALYSIFMLMIVKYKFHFHRKMQTYLLEPRFSSLGHWTCFKKCCIVLWKSTETTKAKAKLVTLQHVNRKWFVNLLTLFLTMLGCRIDGKNS